MNILRVEKVQDCLDGSGVFVYVLDGTWSPLRIRCLEELGDLDYYTDFPRPYFRLHGEGGMVAEGVEGEDTCRITLPATGRDGIQRNLEQALRVI